MKSIAETVPTSHSKYSWFSSDGEVPVGHTRFSWGSSELVEDTATSPSTGAVPPAVADVPVESEIPAVKRGFLKSGPNIKEVVDVKQFLESKVKSVLRKAMELHMIEDDEKTPFKSKYEAREMLKPLLSQLQTCEDRVDPNLREAWSDSFARVELLMGNNFVETEELSQGERFLNSAVDRMRRTPERFESEVFSLLKSFRCVHKSNSSLAVVGRQQPFGYAVEQPRRVRKGRGIPAGGPNPSLFRKHSLPWRTIY
jgi:hypothetical protein